MSAADGIPAGRVRVGDTVVARVAALHARAVPGVAELRADLAQRMLGIAGRVFGVPEGAQWIPTGWIPTDGVSATVTGNTATIDVTVVTRLDHNCREVAEQVQRRVAAEVAAFTGLTTAVRVTVADVELGSTGWSW